MFDCIFIGWFATYLFTVLFLNFWLISYLKLVYLMYFPSVCYILYRPLPSSTRLKLICEYIFFIWSFVWFSFRFFNFPRKLLTFFFAVKIAYIEPSLNYGTKSFYEEVLISYSPQSCLLIYHYTTRKTRKWSHVSDWMLLSYYLFHSFYFYFTICLFFCCLN